ncbi:class I SAM-dependent methyltransferase, partial [Myxococcota bacterium]
MNDTADYIAKLRVTDPLRQPLLRAAITALELPEGSSGLDAGCGIGLQIRLLAEAVGSSGHVTGLDVKPEFLEQADRLGEEVGLSGRVSFRKGDVNELPFADNTPFDWLWSASCAGYPAFEPVPLIQELSRVVKPGGTVAILVYSSQMLLPGYPILESRLNATGAGIAPFCASMRPESHWLRASGWLRSAGLDHVTAQTFVGEVQAPLSDELRAAVTALIDMRWHGAQSEIDHEEWGQYQRLCQPDSADFILASPDYYGFFTETLFHGRVARQGPPVSGR